MAPNLAEEVFDVLSMALKELQRLNNDGSALERMMIKNLLAKMMGERNDEGNDLGNYPQHF